MVTLAPGIMSIFKAGRKGKGQKLSAVLCHLLGKAKDFPETPTHSSYSSLVRTRPQGTPARQGGWKHKYLT